MKPLNHKDRKTAVRKFIWSVFPVLLITLIGLWLLFKNSRMHSLFIENKYNIQKMKFIEQANINEKIDSIITFGNKVIDEDMAEDHYIQTQKLISQSVDNCLSYSLLQKEGAPYEIALNVVKSTQASLDSFHTVNKLYAKNFEKLRTCLRMYDENLEK